jgi:uncharacterized membrane protein
MNKLKMTFAFGKENYLLMILGFVLLIIGYMMMSGGATTDPNVFNGEVFSARRITVAPIVCLIGYAVVLVAILYKSKEK